MRSRAIFALVLAAASAFAGQQTFSFERAYKVGEKDSFDFKISFETGIGTYEFQTVMTQTTEKVYENGDADVKTVSSKSKTFLNGQDMKEEVAEQTDVALLDKFGVRKPKEGEKSSFAGFTALTSASYDKPLQIGKEVTTERTDPSNPQIKTTMSMVLESIEKNTAKVVTKMVIVRDPKAPPIKVNLVSLMDTKTSKVNRIDGTASGIQLGEGIEAKSAEFSMVRKK